MDIFPAILRNDIQAVSRIIHNLDTIDNLFEPHMGDTPLQYCIVHGCFTFVKMLAERVDINHQNKNGQTALHYTIFAKNEEVLLYLLKLGANPNLKDRFGHSVLYESLNYVPVFTELLLFEGNAEVDAGAMVRACSNHNVNTIKTMARRMKSLDVCNDFSTPLITLISAGHGLGMVRFFIETCHANPNYCGTSNTTPLILTVVHFFDFKMIEYLLAWGADPNLQDHLKNTALHYTADTGNIGLTSLLLKHGAQKSINHLNLDHETPLYLASKNFGCVDLVRLMLDHGADPNVYGVLASCPIYRIIKNKDLALIRIMKDKITRTDGILNYCISRANESCVRLAVEEFNFGVDAACIEKASACCSSSTIIYLLDHYRGEINFSILASIVKSRKIEVLRYLLQNFEVDLRQMNAVEDTILHVAAAESSDSIVVLLMEQENVDLEHRNLFGSTPMDVAVNKVLFEQMLFYTKNKRIKEVSLFYLMISSSLTE